MKHAIVIGGSIAGLVTARALADHFDRVTVIERDHFPEVPAPRPGVPQTRQIHVLLLKGQMILEQLFPGLQQELGEHGAPEMDWTGDCLTFSFDQWAPRFYSGMTTRFASRELLEWAIRRRLAANPHIHLLQGREVTDLITSPDRSRVTGVQTHSRDERSQAPGELVADLTADASGRESKLPQWLAGLGYEPPPTITVNSFMGYVSRFYRRPPQAKDWKGLFVRGTPPASRRGGAIFPIEGDRWIVNLGAAGKDYPPTDEAGFVEFARSLPSPELYEAIKAAEPLTPMYGYRRTENRLRRYDRMPRWPDNLVALGDAVCAFNPVYGQGMTVAVQGAVLLREQLKNALRDRSPGALAGLGKRFQNKLAALTAVPWSMATSIDYLYPETEANEESRSNRLIDEYMLEVTLLALEDPQTHLAFLKVLHLVEPPSILFRPRIAARVLHHWHRHRGEGRAIYERIYTRVADRKAS